MRDGGLEEAIVAAGGVGRLARALGIAQPSVSAWQRVPAERVLEVEALTAVPRHRLRPDLHPADNDQPDGVDLARANEYQLLGALLLRAPNEALLTGLRGLRGDATPLGVAHAALAQAASRTGREAVEREYFDLFIGLGRGELLPYASYYLTGFLHERPLARVRQDLAALGISRAAGRCEPEDHLGTLCEVMAGLLSRAFEADGGTADRFFARHLQPWAERFFGDLAGASAAGFYRAVGQLGSTFMAIEIEAASLPEIAA